MPLSVLGVTSKRDARHIIYCLSIDKVRRILGISISKRVRSVRQADVSKIDQKQEASGFAHIHENGQGISHYAIFYVNGSQRSRRRQADHGYIGTLPVLPGVGT